MMMDLLRTLRPQTRICLAANITCADEKITTRTAADWRKLIPAKASEEEVGKHVPRVPAIFLIYK
jgi:16S rRNA (cytidine1402-2'-O)-methyltransferase